MIQKVFFSRLFLATVVLPTFLAAVYFGIIASDVYVSQSTFVVRSPHQPSSGVIGELFQGTGFSRAQDGSYTVQGFVSSRDALVGLEKELQIKKMFSDPSVDLLNRFGAFGWSDSFEDFYVYYLDRIVNVTIDPTSSIATLTTRAYSAEDAFRINQHLLTKSEELVNKLNERSQQDMIRFAALEVQNAELKATDAALGLAKYRNENNVIDPEAQASIPLQQIGKLQDEMISTKSQIIQLETVAKHSPALPSLRSRSRLLEREIRNVSGRVAGEGSSSLATKASEFRQRELEKEFADKMLALAMGSLEQARSEAQRKQQYLERIASSSLPDEAMEPRRLHIISGVFMFGLVLWGVLAMMIAGIREHME